MYSYIFLLFLIILSFSGRIYNGDLKLDYANAAKMTTLSFTFMI